MQSEALYDWELLPEYVTTMQFSRMLGRIFASLKPRRRRRVETRLTRAAMYIAMGICGANATDADGQRQREGKRKAYREKALDGLSICRRDIERLRDDRVGSRPDIVAALELLERIEDGVRTRP